MAVVFYPFVMMDIPAGNGLPNPYSDNAGSSGQPPHPWRGRIQRAGLQALLDYWGDNAENPVSLVCGERMIDTDRIFIWAWDARMVPSYHLSAVAQPSRLQRSAAFGRGTALEATLFFPLPVEA